MGHAAAAHAAPVLVLHGNGQITVRNDPPTLTQTPKPPAVFRSHATRSRAAATRTVPNELARLRRLHRTSNASYQKYMGILNAAASTVKRLGGTSRRELQAVINNLYHMAAAGSLTPNRLPVLFLTLDRNRQWWARGRVPGSGDIVGFSGSELDWEYYPGQGIEFQPLATFGKAQWWFAHGRQYYGKGRSLMSELIPLASRRAGGLTWEYYFYFDGGVPPWTSAMSQGTALEALGDGYQAVGDRSYLSLGASALTVFTKTPSRGVGVPTRIGIRYVQYTFDPSRNDEIINAFLQAVIGLGTFAQISGNHLAQHLFNAGNAEAKAEVPSFDTGRWSLYQPGQLDSLSYHQLVTGFLQKLCSMTHAQVYCTTASHFQAYSKHPPPGV
jgi:D-glucuronyl C5-epimerase C-terminus